MLSPTLLGYIVVENVVMRLLLVKRGAVEKGAA